MQFEVSSPIARWAFSSMVVLRGPIDMNLVVCSLIGLVGISKSSYFLSFFILDNQV
jgi:hypothetical protein